MTASHLYPLAGIVLGYGLVIWFNPVRVALRDGLRCVARFERVWLTFALLGFGYSVFQFITFSPLTGAAGEMTLQQVGSIANWNWPRFIDVWGEVPLPALECVAGLFDNATTTYPLSVIAAILLMANWRGLHGALLRALRQRYGAPGLLILGTEHKYPGVFRTGYGFDGIAVALVGGGTALGTTAAAIVFGALRAGATRLQLVGIHPSFAELTQGLAVLLVAAPRLFLPLLARLRGRPAAAASDPPIPTVQP